MVDWEQKESGECYFGAPGASKQNGTMIFLGPTEVLKCLRKKLSFSQEVVDYL